MSDLAFVIPSNRPDKIKDFYAAWKSYFGDMAVIIIEDGPDKTFDLPPTVQHYCWKDLDSPIYPKQSSCIRSFGFKKAYEQGAEYVITLDDDVLPYDRPCGHIQNLTTEQEQLAWGYTISISPRGTPYRNLNRKVTPAISHGVWEGTPDLDGAAQLIHGDKPEFEFAEGLVAPGTYYSMCSMNLAFTREILPAMYFPPMGPDYEFSRFGDIWAGVLSKKVCDHLGLGVWSGSPRVRHERASDVFVNLEAEAPGMGVNEWFWESIDEVQLTSSNVVDCYAELAEKVNFTHHSYWNILSENMLKWLTELSL